jgi:hypothetical protein
MLYADVNAYGNLAIWQGEHALIYADAVTFSAFRAAAKGFGLTLTPEQDALAVEQGAKAV